MEPWGVEVKSEMVPALKEVGQCSTVDASDGLRDSARPFATPFYQVQVTLPCPQTPGLSRWLAQGTETVAATTQAEVKWAYVIPTKWRWNKDLREPAKMDALVSGCT